MTWMEQYPQAQRPTLAQIDAYIASPLWEQLRTYIEQAYEVEPQLDYSCCSGAPGWNVKYRKAGRGLCTLYPDAGRFICLVCIGSKEAMEAEAALGACSDYTRALYWSVKAFNGSRWLMMLVDGPEVLEDVKRLLCARRKPGAGRAKG